MFTIIPGKSVCLLRLPAGSHSSGTDRVLRLWRSTLYPKLVMVDQVVRREDSGRKQFYVKWRNITTGQLVGLKADQLDSYSEEGRP